MVRVLPLYRRALGAMAVMVVLVALMALVALVAPVVPVLALGWAPPVVPASQATTSR
ncbi:hypothetical protein D3C77_503180 [compost metagenome]